MMAIAGRVTVNLQLRSVLRSILHESRGMATVTTDKTEKDFIVEPQMPDNFNVEKQEKIQKYQDSSSSYTKKLLNYRFVYPEFLPDPNPLHRNKLREKIERKDMLARRFKVEIPEFYVGSIVAVVHSDIHAPGKSNRFLGICIQRKGCGLRASFILRNVIDNLGVEVNFDMYDPTIQKIEVIRLEKRLDEELFYLRDCPNEYSTFPLDMEIEYHAEGTPIPVNDIKLPLKPLPWLVRWERMNMKGLIDPLSMVNERKQKKAALKIHTRPWEKYDLMKMYRETIPEDEQIEIFSELNTKLHELEHLGRKLKRSRTFVKPKKSG